MREHTKGGGRGQWRVPRECYDTVVRQRRPDARQIKATEILRRRLCPSETIADVRVHAGCATAWVPEVCGVTHTPSLWVHAPRHQQARVHVGAPSALCIVWQLEVVVVWPASLVAADVWPCTLHSSKLDLSSPNAFHCRCGIRHLFLGVPSPANPSQPEVSRCAPRIGADAHQRNPSRGLLRHHGDNHRSEVAACVIQVSRLTHK